MTEEEIEKLGVQMAIKELIQVIVVFVIIIGGAILCNKLIEL